MNNKNQSNYAKKLKERQNNMDSKLFYSIISNSMISAVGAVFAVFVNERITKFTEDCKKNNSIHFFCFAYLNEHLKLITFFILTTITTTILGLLLYFIFGKKV